MLTDEERARLSDIPFTFDAAPWKLSNLNKEHQIALEYYTRVAIQDIISLYRAEMDYWGWREIDIVTDNKSCLVFQKPSRNCIVLISPYKSGYLVTIFIGRNKNFN